MGSSGQRWIAIAIMLMGSLDVADGVYSRDYRRLMTGSLFVSMGFSLIFPLGRLRVCEKGIETGLLVLAWKQISGWEWGPSSESRKRPASLDIEGPGERQLYLWTPSRWRFFYDLRPARPIKTKVPFDERLNSLLEEHSAGTATGR